MINRVRDYGEFKTFADEYTVWMNICCMVSKFFKQLFIAGQDVNAKEDCR
jgi:hypothetical protein